jgi:TolA-binding protein
MFRSNKSMLALLFLTLTSCKTSGDLKTGKDPRVNDDPSGVRTLDAPPSPGEIATRSEAPPATQKSAEVLERELEVTQGELENLRHQIEKERQEWQLRQAEIEAEKKKLEEALVSRPAQSAPVAASGDGDKNTVEALWRQGIESAQKKNDAEALVSLKSLLANYPKSKHVWGATLTAGMLEYRLKNYKVAAIYFNQAIDMTAKRSVGPSLAWYFQGLSFYKMNKKEDAALFFGELDRRFAKTPVNAKARRILAGKAKAPNDLFADIPNWLDFVGP